MAVPPKPEEIEQPPNMEKLGDSIDIKLGDWLKLSRKELAEMTRDAQDRLDNILKEAREPEAVAFPERAAHAADPTCAGQSRVFGKAGYQSAALRQGRRADDPDLAMHLARHGDVDAALKLVDPANKELIEKLESYRAAQNYPVEWTRLVGLAAASRAQDGQGRARGSDGTGADAPGPARSAR